MGEYISIGDGIIVTLFSIVMVFVVLVIISAFISMLKFLDKKEIEPVKEVMTKDDKAKETKDPEMVESVDDEELIAVISAAVAASMGLALPDINIQSIKRVETSQPAWARAGRQEQINGKL